MSTSHVRISHGAVLLSEFKIFKLVRGYSVSGFAPQTWPAIPIILVIANPNVSNLSLSSTDNLEKSTTLLLPVIVADSNWARDDGGSGGAVSSWAWGFEFYSLRLTDDRRYEY